MPTEATTLDPWKLLMEYTWECPDCGSLFTTEEEADRCYQMDTWPEDCREWMRGRLVAIAVEFWT